jgi:hypothetical protein
MGYSRLSDITCTDVSSYRYILLLHLYLGCTSTWRGIPLGYLLCLLVQGHQGPHVFSGVFMAEEVDGVGEKVSGDATTVDVRTLLEALFNMSLRSACFIDDDVFFW